jgi:integrase
MLQAGFVFPGQRPKKPLSTASMTAVLKRMGMSTKATTHGFRSSFRDWVGDETTFPSEIAEAALAHKIKNEAEAAYRRRTAIEKRRGLMEAWARYCADGSNVVSLVKTA